MGLVAFFVGSIPVYWYGLTAMIAVTVAFLIARIIFSAFEEDSELLYDVFLFGLPLGLAMAHFVHALLRWLLGEGNFLDTFLSFGSGYSVYGAALGGFFAVMLVSYHHGRSVWEVLDLLAPAFVFALSIMQFGNFFLQITIGVPMLFPETWSLAEYIEYRYRPSGFEGNEYFHPIAFYQGLLQIVVAFLLMMVFRFRKSVLIMMPGAVFFVAVLVIAVIRFLCGFWYFSWEIGLNYGQIASLILFCVAGVGFFIRIREKRRFL